MSLVSLLAPDSGITMRVGVSGAWTLADVFWGFERLRSTETTFNRASFYSKKEMMTDKGDKVR